MGLEPVEHRQLDHGELNLAQSASIGLKSGRRESLRATHRKLWMSLQRIHYRVRVHILNVIEATLHAVWRPDEIAVVTVYPYP